MSKRAKFLLVAALSVLTIGVIAFAGVALAADPVPPTPTPPVNVPPGWGCYGGNGGGFGPVWSDTVTKLLGLTPEQIQAQRQEGKSLAQIAAAKGVTEDALVNAILAPRKDIMQQRVTAGYMTQDQLNLMFKTMEQNLRAQVKQTTIGPTAGRGAGGFGPGMMRGWGGQTNQPNPTNPGAGYGPGRGMMGGRGVWR